MTTLIERTNPQTRITCYVMQYENGIISVGLYDPNFDRSQVLLTTEHVSEAKILEEFIASSDRLGCI